MKNLTLLLVFTFISISGFAQWQSNGNNIYYDSGYVGIGITDPTYKLELAGLQDYADNQRTFLRLINHSTSHNSLVNLRLFAGLNSTYTSLSHKSETYSATANQADFGDLFSNGAGLLLRASGGIIRLETSTGIATEERMRISSEGLIGIGTDEPVAKLQVADGDIYISDISQGVIMKSPDGQCWKGTLNNNGILNFVPIECLDTDTQVPSQNVNTTISISPNPATQYVSITVDEKDLNELNYTLTDLYGRKVLDGQIMSNIERINIENLGSGAYILSVYNKPGNILISEKIIKK